MIYSDLEESAGPCKDGKITAWEGGFRVPSIFWWTETIQPQVVTDIGVNIHLIKTIANITNTNLPEDHHFDSLNLSPTLLFYKPSSRTKWFYYGQSSNLWAACLVRKL